MMSNDAKNFDILTIGLNVLHNIFNSSITLFSNLYLAKFLAKLFFSYRRMTKTDAVQLSAFKDASNLAKSIQNGHRFDQSNIHRPIAAAICSILLTEKIRCSSNKKKSG